VGDFATSPGGFNEWVSLFCGRGRRPDEGSLHGLASEQEDIRILPMPASEALALLAAGRIQNAITLIALQWLALTPRLAAAAAGLRLKPRRRRIRSD